MKVECHPLFRAQRPRMRVAAGAIARKYLASQGVTVRGYMSQLGPIEIPFESWEAVSENAFFSPSPMPPTASPGLGPKANGRSPASAMRASCRLRLASSLRNSGGATTAVRKVESKANQSPATVYLPARCASSAKSVSSWTSVLSPSTDGA